MSCILYRRWSYLKSLALQSHTISIPKSAYTTGIDGEAYITPESNPGKHSKSDIGFMYKIDNSLSWDTLFKPLCSLEPHFVEECKTFGGTYVMIRKPALEVIKYLQHANYDAPINKYVLFGKYGSGVTTTLMHIVHYAHLSEWILVHTPSIIHWLTKKTERMPSTTREGVLDLPVLGSNWLSHFKNQNLNVINKLDLRLQNDYTWNIQEENKKGESLLGLVDHGISRGTYSCDVIFALLSELKQLAKSGKIKVLVAIDNYSVIFHPGRKSSNRKIKNLSPQQLSFIEAFKDMTNSDWHNGAAVLTCAAEKQIRSDIDHFPMNKLTRYGFEFLEPFVPIEVPRLTEAEMTSLFAFYKSRKWISVPNVEREVKILSTGNIRTFKRLCGPL